MYGVSHLVGPVDLKLNAHLAGDLVLPLCRVDQGLVLVVGVVGGHHHVEHHARVRHLERLALGRLKLVVFREAARQGAPDAVRVQLKRLAQLLYQRVGRLDDPRPRVGHHPGHLHAVPPCPLKHNNSQQAVKPDPKIKK
eukprot:scaffold436661_cov23-Prasinocladus_malaysianus.AAC.1